MSGRKQRPVDAEELLREPVTDHDSGQVDQLTRIPLGLFPDRRLPCLDVRLVE